MRKPAAVTPRVQSLHRIFAVTESLPWWWIASDVEDFTVSLKCGPRLLAPSTVHLTLRMSCDYLTDVRYDWVGECSTRFGRVPSQVSRAGPRMVMPFGT